MMENAGDGGFQEVAVCPQIYFRTAPRNFYLHHAVLL
jgi:hypothetical protein